MEARSIGVATIVARFGVNTNANASLTVQRAFLDAAASLSWTVPVMDDNSLEAPSSASPSFPPLPPLFPPPPAAFVGCFYDYGTAKEDRAFLNDGFRIGWKANKAVSRCSERCLGGLGHLYM